MKSLFDRIGQVHDSDLCFFNRQNLRIHAWTEYLRGVGRKRVKAKLDLVSP